MKEEIINYLRSHPLSRKRSIASYLRIWVCDKNFLDTMYNLEKEGIIKSITYRDFANMEYYAVYRVVERG